MTEDERAGLLDGLTAIASRAAAAILNVADPAATRRDKADGSAVTEADEAAEAVIAEGLAGLLPGVPVVSEESVGRAPQIDPSGRFLIVDPLDGTRELLAGEVEYTVNIALVEAGTPVLGVIAAPPMATVWRGMAGRGAERLRLAPGEPPAAATGRTAIRTRPVPAGGPLVVRSRFHHSETTQAYIETIPGARPVVVGSSVKFCRLAEGAADAYPRFSPMSEWDIGAGHALLVAAGGAITATDGSALRYGQPGFRVNGFLAWGDPAAARAWLRAKA